MEWESIQGAVCSMAFFLLVAAGLLSPHPGREGCIQVVYMYFSLFFLNWLICISYMYSYDDVDFIANWSGGNVPKHLQSSHCKTPCLSGLHYFSSPPFPHRSLIKVQRSCWRQLFIGVLHPLYNPILLTQPGVQVWLGVQAAKRNSIFYIFYCYTIHIQVVSHYMFY